VDGGAGGGTGGAGGGGVGAFPHHLALPPPLQVPKQVSSDMQPAFVLQRPQLQSSSQLYPHASTPSLQTKSLEGDGAGDGPGVGMGVGLGVTSGHHFALLPPLQFPIQVSSDKQPGAVLQCPQLQLLSQL